MDISIKKRLCLVDNSYYMNKKTYLEKIVRRIKVCFWILLLVTVYEVFYWLTSHSGLSFVLVVLAGAVTFFAFTLMKVFEDMHNSNSN